MYVELLSGWREGRTKQAIVGFVDRTCGENAATAVPVEERVAVFDNDGTSWCEQPMPIQVDFILRRLVAMAQAQPELRSRATVAGRVRARLRLVRHADGRALCRQ